MKKEGKKLLSLQPVPATIVSCRDKEGRNNALVVGFTANVSLEPAMIMVGIVPERFSHHMVKETGCFVVNLPKKSFKKEYDYLGSHSGRDGDKFEALGLNLRSSSSSRRRSECSRNAASRLPRSKNRTERRRSTGSSRRVP